MASPIPTAAGAIARLLDVSRSTGASRGFTRLAEVEPLLDVYCFDQADKLLSSVRTFANGPDKLAPEGTVSFDVDLFMKPCPTFLVGSSGYFE